MTAEKKTIVTFNYPYFNGTLQGIGELIGNGSNKHSIKIRVLQGFCKGHTTEIPLKWVENVGEAIELQLN